MDIRWTAWAFGEMGNNKVIIARMAGKVMNNTNLLHQESTSWFWLIGKAMNT